MMSEEPRRHSKAPFLHRNWRTAIKMVTKRSLLHNPLGDEDGRPAKRRRLDDTASLFDGKTLVEGQDNLQRALRIEILKMAHKDSPRGTRCSTLDGQVVPSARHVSEMKAKCKISISCQLGGVEETVYSDSQICVVKPFKDAVANSPVARVYCKPFQVAEEKLLVQHHDDEVFGLAKSYTMSIEMQSGASQNPNWPPLDLGVLPDGGAFAKHGALLPSRLWTLSAVISDIFGSRTRRNTRLRLRKSTQTDVLTNFALEMDLRWTMNNAGCQTKTADEKDVSSFITDGDPYADVVLTNGTSHCLTKETHVHGLDCAADGPNGIHMHLPLLDGHLNDEGGRESPDHHLLKDQAEGDLTPNRSKRARKNVDYNVKRVFQTIQGKEPLKPRGAPNSQNSGNDRGVVTYVFTTEHVQVDNFCCFYCGAVHNSASQLRAHLMSHPQVEFHFDVHQKGGCHIVVETEPYGATETVRGKVYQLGLPVRRFDLDKYVEGDDSWIRSRLGRDNECETARKMVRAKGPKVGNARAPMRQSKVDLRQRLGPRRSLKRPVVVPDVKLPLFDYLTKAEALPGTVVQPHEVDDDWLIQKHRDNIAANEHTDPFEKEYMEHWNYFALTRSINHVEYIARAFLTFVDEEASWIVANSAREKQFSKHAASLLARSDINTVALVEATRKLTEARTKKVEPPKPTTSPKKRSPLDHCGTCRQPVAVAEMLVCCNKTCRRRVYHAKCVLGERKSISPVRSQNWLCRKCMPRGIYGTVDTA